MDRACHTGVDYPQLCEAETGEDKAEHRAPWPLGPTDGERNEMPCEVIAMAAADEARWRRKVDRGTTIRALP
jgi:hypothetical protein